MILSAPRPRIAGAATAFPARVVGADETFRVLSRFFPEERPEGIEGMIRRSGVRTRHVALEPEEILAERGFGERNREYREAALDLATRAARTALERAGLDPAEIDAIVDVSCTGFLIPALDVELVSRLGLRPDVRRVPISESGCAGGAVGLGLAALLAQGGLRVLLCAVELCTLSRVPGDRSRTNLVASILFGDGSAACVVTPHRGGSTVEALGTRLIPRTQHLMGFDVSERGLSLVLDRELPARVSDALPEAVQAFLTEHGRETADIDFHLVHPGGRPILDAYERGLELEPDALRHSRGILERRGNTSSVSVLAVLESALVEAAERPSPTEALLVALGPGLTIEMALLGLSGRARQT